MTNPMLFAPVAAALALLCYPQSVTVPLPRPRSSRWGRGAGSPNLRRSVMAGIGVTAGSMLLDWWPGWVAMLVGAGVGGLVGGLPSGIPVRHKAADRSLDRRRLAVHADLLAACLDAGMSVGPALQALARPGLHREDRAGTSAVSQPRAFADPSDPLARLEAVAALLLLGADPERAWHGVRDHPDLAALAAAARRTAAGGAVFAEAVREHAVVLRSAESAAAERAAGRAGVAITAPLGLCFLPAFLCLGLVPVVVGLLASVHLY
jgi:pilus assembly protein TadC